MQHNGLMDAFYGFQPIIIMDLLTKVLDALYIPFMDKKRTTKTEIEEAENVRKYLPAMFSKFRLSVQQPFDLQLPQLFLKCLKD